GPDGGTPRSPVGRVYIGWSFRGKTRVWEKNLFGDRSTIRERAALGALNALRENLGKD
ncbi:MAG TPA: CinA family protein, partial [Elusimicrobiota bacterium]|nr:CinA family protein [Elusimicrobiota bacterium]